MVFPFVGVCLAIGLLSSFLGGAWKPQPWIDETPKPNFWPPQWIFPPVWVGNYIIMGVASFLIWQNRQRTSVTKPLTVFAIHLLHNFSFIPIVYRLKRKSVYVLMDSIGLGSGLVTASMFVRVSRAAGLIMLPYLGWLWFTTYIKVLWWQMNTK